MHGANGKCGVRCYLQSGAPAGGLGTCALWTRGDCCAAEMTELTRNTARLAGASAPASQRSLFSAQQPEGAFVLPV